MTPEQIPDDYKLVSFDVKITVHQYSTLIGLTMYWDHIQQSTVKLLLPTEDIMGLLSLCLTSTYSQYNGKHYKQ